MMDDDITLSSSLSFYLKPFDNTVQSLLFCQRLRGREKSFQANTVFDNLQHNGKDIHSGADYVLPTGLMWHQCCLWNKKFAENDSDCTSSIKSNGSCDADWLL